MAALSLSLGVPLSTLKLNARILRDLDLISTAENRARLSASGREVVLLLRDHLGQVFPVQEVRR